jgi:hypothetical protein
VNENQGTNYSFLPGAIKINKKMQEQGGNKKEPWLIYS